MLAGSFEKAVEFSGFLFKEGFEANFSFIKHTILGTQNNI